MIKLQSYFITQTRWRLYLFKKTNSIFIFLSKQELHEKHFYAEEHTHHRIALVMLQPTRHYQHQHQ